MTVDRSKLLDAAARVYSEHGFRGATTRRIADEAGVNEITIFRQFGSKEALINEAIRNRAIRPWPPELPTVPVHPAEELTTWCSAVLAHLSDARSLIRRMMSEMEERPGVAPCVGEGPTHAAQHLRAYAQGLRTHGFISPTPSVAASPAEDEPADRRNPQAAATVDDTRADAASCLDSDPDACAAVSMLMAVLFADAMCRDMIPAMYPQPPERTAATYVKLFLVALGVPVPAVGRPGPESPVR
jgi:AcrR family transcriptional regulator